MTSPLRAGIIGLDTSHAPAFTRLLNDASDPHAVTIPGGARVVAAYPGGSDDFELSRSRVAKFTSDVEAMGVRILASPAAVADSVDLILLESADGRVHRDLFDQLAQFGKPIFVDKPLALSAADASAMIATARSSGFAMMSASALRYCDAIVAAIGQRDDILGCDVYGPLAFEATQPGWFWYGIHIVEMAVAAMGAGCVSVSVAETTTAEVATCVWHDGRIATLRGVRDAHSVFGLTVHAASGVRPADSTQSKKPIYASLLNAAMATLPGNQWAVPGDEMLETIRIIEAINASRMSRSTVRLS